MKNIKWMIQSTGFNTSYLQEVAFALEKLKLPFEDYGIIEDTVTNLENIFSGDVDVLIARGGTKLLRIIEGLKNVEDFKRLNGFLSDEQLTNYEKNIKLLKSSIDYDEERFDQRFYQDMVPVLNDDSSFFTVESLLYSEFENDYFVKPSKDAKSFNGGVIYAGETLNNYLMRTPHRNIEEISQEIVLVAPLREIQNEYRFFMYKDRILGCSQYMVKGKVQVDPFVPDNVRNTAEMLGSLYNPADIYVVDLCTFEESNDIRIVEYNCWNCSGFYACDIKNILNEITKIKKGNINV